MNSPATPTLFRALSSLSRIQPAPPPYRADIDGCRAIAVLSVMVFHAFPEVLHGGFVGVDVFFVISGFLISSIIAGNLAQGTFSFADFYARRIKRIFPALLLVLSACYLLGWFALFPDEYKQLGKHIFAGTGFFSNFVLWSEAGYFDNAATTKPLLHLWSLGIEEQFYIMWPLLLFLAWKRKFDLLRFAAIIAVVSFAVNAINVSRDATATFYSPVTRIWELLIGAVIALRGFRAQMFANTANERGAAFLRNTGNGTHPMFGSRIFKEAQPVAGLALIVLAMIWFDKTSLFPGWLALVPTLGAALIIAADPDAWLNRRVLSHRALVWIGLISYPLYLWHWPLLSLAQIVESGTVSVEIRFAALLLAALLAWLTFVLIEKPVRFGKRSLARIMVLCVLMFVIGVIGYNAYSRNGLPFRSTIKNHLTQQQALAWKNDWDMQDACTKQYPVHGRYCLQSDASRPPTVALIGDSHANHLYIGLEKYYKDRGENLLMMGERLPFWNVETGPPGTEATFVLYKDIMNDILDRVTRTESIKTVILASAGVVYLVNTSYHLKLTTRPQLEDHEQIFAEAMRQTLARLVAAGKQVIFVVDIPELRFEPKSCLDDRPVRLTSRVRSPCAVERHAFDDRAADYHKMIDNVLRDFPDVKSFSTYKELCDERYCRAMRDGKLLYRDENHLSYEGSLYIGGRFALTER